MDPADIAQALRAAIQGEVDESSRRRAEYSSDASNYRVVPQVVAFPRDTSDILAAAEVSRQTGTPLTTRGAGTSIAGNAVGAGIVLDTSRHLNRILDLDPQARTARVEPGVILASLQAAAAPHGLRFGPDPSTQSRATLGGMIGNNACGAHALAYGRTADNVLELDVIDGTGRRFTAAGGLDPVPGLDKLVSANLALLRTEFGRLRRQVSGYSLEHLLPENGARLARALAGTEGTVVTMLGATVRLVPVARAHALVVLGYPDVADAADAVPAILAHGPLAIEGLDARMVDVVRRRKGSSRVPELPPGDAWLMVEMGAGSPAEAVSLAQAMLASAGALAATVIPAGPEASAIWRIREDGAGLAGRTPDNKQAWPGWEDAAVQPDRLGAYLREFRALLGAHHLDGLLYGHFGDGCIHVRIDFPLDRPGGAQVMREFLTEAAHLVTAHGGSLSGEHGDGRARSELLPVMYSPDALAAFGAFKHLLDPADLLNPGVLVRPRPLDADLRRPAAVPLPRQAGFAFTEDDGDLTTAVHRCVGVGKCRADSSASGGFMCPSYLATRDEKDSTRGRARVLQEMANGTLVSGGWRSPEVRDSLDLCLSCKACSADCPAGIDMARYKSEVAYRAYRRRLRPRSHYALGQLPRWARLAGAAPRLVNALLRIRPLATAVLAAGGMDTRRAIPSFAEVPFRRSAARRPAAGRAATPAPAAGSPDRRVVLWADSFSDAFDPGVPQAALQVLGQAWLPGDRPRTFRLLRPDLDQHRPAGRGPPEAGHPARRPRPVRRGRDPHRRAGALVHRRAPVRPGRPVPRRPPGRRGGGNDPHTGRAAHRAPAARPGTGVGPAGPGRHRDHRPAALPPLLGDGLRPGPGAAGRGRGHGHHAGRVLRTGRQLRHGKGPLRGVRGGGGAGPAARAAGRRARHGLPGRRLLLPHPGRPARRRAGPAPGPDPRRPAPSLTGPGRDGAATLRSRLPMRRCGTLLGDGVAAVHDHALPGDVGRAGCGQPGYGGGDLAR